MEARKRGRPTMTELKQERNPITPTVHGLNPDAAGEMEKRSRQTTVEQQLHGNQPLPTAFHSCGVSPSSLPDGSPKGFIRCKVEGAMISHDQSCLRVSPIVKELMEQYKFLSTKSPLEKFVLMRSILEKDVNILQLLQAQTQCAAQVADTATSSTLERFDNSVLAEHLSNLLEMNGDVEANADALFAQRPLKEATADVYGNPSDSLNPKKIVTNQNDKSLDHGSSREPSGYIVKEEFTHILRKIMTQHGDIARDCSFTSLHFRSHFLERICRIYKELEESNIFKIEVSRVSSIYEDLKDLQHANVEVKWLQDRVDQIVEATEGLTIAFISRQIVKQNAGVVARKAQLLEGYRKELDLHKVRVAMLEKVIKTNEEGLAAEQRITKAFSGYSNSAIEKVKPLVQSLVHDLLP